MKALFYNGPGEVSVSAAHAARRRLPGRPGGAAANPLPQAGWTKVILHT
jgi:hypothetical protein